VEHAEHALVGSRALLIIFFHPVLVELFGCLVLSAFLVRGITERFLGLRQAERGPSCTGEDADNEALEEGLDDVHHIRAEVPDHIKLVQHGQGTPDVDAGLEANVIDVFPGMVGFGLRKFRFCAGLAVGPCRRRSFWSSLPQGIIRMQPPDMRYVYVCKKSQDIYKYPRKFLK
jgi:hypothetical protein